MAVRALNIKSAPKIETKLAVHDTMGEHTASVIAALLDNNRGEAARAFARARLAGCDLTTIQKRAFDAEVSGALLRQAFTLSKEHTAESLSRGNAAVNALSEGAKINAKQERDAKASEPLKVKAFAGLFKVPREDDETAHYRCEG